MSTGPEQPSGLAGQNDGSLFSRKARAPSSGSPVANRNRKAASSSASPEPPGTPDRIRSRAVVAAVNDAPRGNDRSLRSRINSWATPRSTASAAARSTVDSRPRARARRPARPRAQITPGAGAPGPRAKHNRADGNRETRSEHRARSSAGDATEPSTTATVTARLRVHGSRAVQYRPDPSPPPSNSAITSPTSDAAATKSAVWPSGSSS